MTNNSATTISLPRNGFFIPYRGPTEGPTIPEGEVFGSVEWTKPFNELKREFQFIPMVLPKKTPIGRNGLCLCGSGKKFKKCCMSKGQVNDE